MDIKNFMEDQLSDALVRVKSILSDVNKSAQSVSNKQMLLPHISDILSEISFIVSCEQQSLGQDDTIQADDNDEELWWDSSPECVHYSDSDEEQSMVSTILFSSSDNLGSLTSLSSVSSDDQTKDFINKILSTLSRSAPGDVFSLANIPRPTLQPVYGCSNDPTNHTPFPSDGYGCVGLLYGYDTMHGIVPVPDHPIHGYIWDHLKGDWILHSDVSVKEPGRGRSHSRNQRG